MMMCLMITRSDELVVTKCQRRTNYVQRLSFLSAAYLREIFSKVSTTSKRFLSSADNTALPGLSTTKDFMPAAIAASTSLTLSLRNRIASGDVYVAKVSTSNPSKLI